MTPTTVTGECMMMVRRAIALLIFGIPNWGAQRRTGYAKAFRVRYAMVFRAVLKEQGLPRRVDKEYVANSSRRIRTSDACTARRRRWRGVVFRF